MKKHMGLISLLAATGLLGLSYASYRYIKRKAAIKVITDAHYTFDPSEQFPDGWTTNDLIAFADKIIAWNKENNPVNGGPPVT